MTRSATACGIRERCPTGGGDVGVEQGDGRGARRGLLRVAHARAQALGQCRPRTAMCLLRGAASTPRAVLPDAEGSERELARVPRDFELAVGRGRETAAPPGLVRAAAADPWQGRNKERHEP